MKLHWDAIFFASIELAILANLIILDLALFGMLRPKSIQPAQILPSAVSKDECGPACRTVVNEQISQALLALPHPTPNIEKQTVQTSISAAKEFFIPFGSGSTQNDQWENVPGVVSFIDTANYTSIATVYFEVSMSIPTKNGIVSARLYNVTDKHPVWLSDVSTDSDTSTLVASKIQLDPGNIQYQVQMKTSLKYPSIMDFARVKIITK